MGTVSAVVARLPPHAQPPELRAERVARHGRRGRHVAGTAEPAAVMTGVSDLSRAALVATTLWGMVDRLRRQNLGRRFHCLLHVCQRLAGRWSNRSRSARRSALISWTMGWLLHGSDPYA